jgi:hypothetical protein
MNDISGVGTTYKGVVTANANDVVLAQSGEKNAKLLTGTEAKR